MPFAPKIRKDLLQALETAIIPALNNSNIPQILADPVRGLHGVEFAVEQEKFLAHREHRPLQKITTWAEEFQMSFSKPAFYFVYQGLTHERLGMTETDYQRYTQQKRNHPVAGIVGFDVAAPAVIFYPAYTVHNNGSAPMPPHADGLVLCVKLIDELIQVSHFGIGSKTHTFNHNLAIADNTLVQLGQIYQRELAEPDNETVSQAILLAFMGRLTKHLKNVKPGISNSCWVTLEQEELLENHTISQKNLQLFNQVNDYIQAHLNEELSVEIIAAHCGASRSHINRVFRSIKNVSLMQYVTEMRIETAKTILVSTSERINDISHLVGFASAASFCTVFQKKVRLSPREYRYQERLKRAEGS
jgi:AraC-like DNA-binding protein